MTAHARARRPIALAAAGLAATLLLGGCVAGEGSTSTATAGAAEGSDTADGTWSADTLTLDYATYNPLSLVIKDQGWLEDTLGDDVTVKRLRRTTAGIELLPENPDYPVITVQPGEPFEIEGLAVGLIRNTMLM